MTYVCEICGYEYDPEKGDPDYDIPVGTAWEDLGEEWHCPLCKAPKSDFTEN